MAVERSEKVLMKDKRHRRIRKNVSGTQSRPRLCVFRSLNHTYAQIIDDAEGRTLAAASTLDPEIKDHAGHRGNVKTARLIGERLGRRAREKGIARVVFDRGGYLFHGRVKAVAEGAREAGLEF